MWPIGFWAEFLKMVLSFGNHISYILDQNRRLVGDGFLWVINDYVAASSKTMHLKEQLGLTEEY